LHTRKFCPVGILKLVDAGNQGVSGRFFFGCDYRVPGFVPLNFFGTVKVRKTIYLGRGGLILDVKPFPAPTLDRVGEFHIEVIDIGADGDANATYIVDDALRVVAPEEENAFPEAPVRVDAQETLTEGDKDGDMEKGVWGQLVMLDPVNKKQTTKKFVDRNS
jgi:hypothetical protein